MLWVSTVAVWLLDYIDKRPIGTTSVCSRGSVLFAITVTIHLAMTAVTLK